MSSTAAAGACSHKARLRHFWGKALAGLVTLFVLLHLQVVRAYLLLPWVSLLAELASRTLSFFGQEVTSSGTLLRSATLSLDVSESCGGLEIVGLYLALTFAYPAPWRWRLGGAVCWLALFQVLNFLRILSFFWLQDWQPLRLSSGQVFSSLHLYLWPVVMVGVGCVLWGVWIGKVREQQADAGGGPSPTEVSFGHMLRPSLPAFHSLLLFAGVAFILLLLFPRFIENLAMQRFAAAITTGAAWVLSFVGVPAVAQGFLLKSGTGALNVLPGCTATPLIILYLAGALAFPLSWKGKGLLVVLCLPLFYLLNVVRVVVLVLAEAYLPGLGGFFYNFFFQLCLLGVMTIGMGWWMSTDLEGKDRRAFWLRLALSYGGGLVLWQVVGKAYDALVFGSHEMVLREMDFALPDSLPYDPNRVLSYLPAFQVVIFLTFTLALPGLRRWRALLLGGLLLYLSQLFFLLSISFLGSTFHYFPHVRYLRAWVLTVPFLLVWFLSHRERPGACAS